MIEDPNEGKEDKNNNIVESEKETPTFWSWIKQTARLWGFFVFILLVILIFRSVILPFILAILVTYILVPVVRILSKIKIGTYVVPRFVWVILVYVMLVSGATLFFTSFVPRLSGDLRRIVGEAPAFWKRANEQWVPVLANWIRERVGNVVDVDKTSSNLLPKPVSNKLKLRNGPDGELEVDIRDLHLEIIQKGDGSWELRPPTEEELSDKTTRFEDSIHKYLREIVYTSESQIEALLKVGQKLLVGLLAAITTFILVLMVSAFLLLDTEKILAWFRNLVPLSFHKDFDNVVVLVDKGLSGAIRGQLLICFINAVLTWIGLKLFGIKYSFLLAVMAGVMSLIPIFGSILSSIPIILVALVSGPSGIDLIRGIGMLGWIIGIHLLEANLLNPKIIGSAAKIHPVIVIFAVVAGEQTYGPIGALLAVPLVSAVSAVFVYLRRKVRGELS